jgi:hypothetical protein
VHLVGFYCKNKARNSAHERETAGHQRKIRLFGERDQIYGNGKWKSWQKEINKKVDLLGEGKIKKTMLYSP